MEKKIYAGFFLEDGAHVTWEFAPGKCSLPWEVDPGEECLVRIVGKYNDDDIEADIVEVYPPTGTKLTEQSDDKTVLHITRRASIAPVEAGIRATELGWKPIQEEECETLKATAGYFMA